MTVLSSWNLCYLGTNNTNVVYPVRRTTLSQYRNLCSRMERTYIIQSIINIIPFHFDASLAFRIILGHQLQYVCSRGLLWHACIPIYPTLINTHCPRSNFYSQLTVNSLISWCRSNQTSILAFENKCHPFGSVNQFFSIPILHE